MEKFKNFLDEANVKAINKKRMGDRLKKAATEKPVSSEPKKAKFDKDKWDAARKQTVDHSPEHSPEYLAKKEKNAKLKQKNDKIKKPAVPGNTATKLDTRPLHMREPHKGATSDEKGDKLAMDNAKKKASERLAKARSDLAATKAPEKKEKPMKIGTTIKAIKTPEQKAKDAKQRLSTNPVHKKPSLFKRVTSILGKKKSSSEIKSPEKQVAKQQSKPVQDKKVTSVPSAKPKAVKPTQPRAEKPSKKGGSAIGRGIKHVALGGPKLLGKTALGVAKLGLGTAKLGAHAIGATAHGVGKIAKTGAKGLSSINKTIKKQARDAASRQSNVPMEK
jgi:hypothetical protein